MVLGSRHFDTRSLARGSVSGSASAGLGQAAGIDLEQAGRKSLLHHLPGAGRHPRRHRHRHYRRKAPVRGLELEPAKMGEEGVLED
jgi:hypothetical protein